MLEQMFEVTFTRFHATMQTFAPLIELSSIVVAETHESVVECQATHVRCPST